MTASTVEINTPSRNGVDFSFPAAAAKILAGSIVVLNSSGNAEMATTATGKVAVGVAQATVDNSGGNAGDLNVPVRRGVFRFANSASTDALAATDIGATCYLVDNVTVAKTGAPVSSVDTRSKGGIVRDVDADGVWVEF